MYLYVKCNDVVPTDMDSHSEVCIQMVTTPSRMIVLTIVTVYHIITKEPSQ